MPNSIGNRVTSPADLVGTTLNGQYELLELLGDGILFATFRAQDKTNNRPLVVKTLLPEQGNNDEIVASLRTGIGDVLALSHVGIARPLDVGAEREGGIPFFLAEEYVRGIDLRERIRRNAPLAHSVAVDVVIAIADALQYAAERNVSHGDLRPTHILTGPESPIKVTAWGIAEAQSIAAGENPTLLLAAAPYTAPDVWATGTPTPYGDLYALGVILYEMLTGSLPFSDKGDALAIARRHSSEPVPSPKEFQSSVPRALDGATQKLLAKRPADRYRSATELLADMRTIRDALRFGRSLSWSPLDAEERPVIPNAEAVRGDWTETGTAVMPVGVPRTIQKAVVTEPKSTKPEPAPTKVVESLAQSAVIPQPLIPTVVTPESPTDDFVTLTNDEEDEPLSAIMPAPAQKRKGASFNWLLPINLLLSIVLVGMLVYLVKTTFLALEPPNDVIVPNLVGKTLTEARSLASERKFLVDVVNEQYSDKYPEDTIYEMRPEPGRHIREGKKVAISVSKGPRMVTVPDVYDVSFDKARQVLEKVGLRVGDKKYEWDVITSKGNIMSQIPPANENRPRGTKVDLTVSKGPEPVEPDPVYTPLDTSPSPDPSNPEATAENESSLQLTYPVPNDASTHVIRIDCKDSRGFNTLITESHNAGDNVQIDVKGYGKEITFWVYDNDVLQDKKTGPPWRSSGEKKP